MTGRGLDARARPQDAAADPGRADPGTRAGGAGLAALADLLAVLLFVAVGRRSHADGASTAAVLGGVLATAWPFLTGTAVGWLGVRAWRAPTRVLPTGVVVWVATLGVGMVLRGLTGGGLAVSFVLVAAGVLGLLLLGWRAAGALVGRRGHGTGAGPVTRT